MLDPGNGKSHRTFARVVYENKNSVDNLMKSLVREAASKELDSPLIICCIVAEKQKFEDNLDKHGRSRQRFLVLFLSLSLFIVNESGS